MLVVTMVSCNYDTPSVTGSYQRPLPQCLWTLPTGSYSSTMTTFFHRLVEACAGSHSLLFLATGRECPPIMDLDPMDEHMIMHRESAVTLPLSAIAQPRETILYLTSDYFLIGPEDYSEIIDKVEGQDSPGVLKAWNNTTYGSGWLTVGLWGDRDFWEPHLDDDGLVSRATIVDANAALPNDTAKLKTNSQAYRYDTPHDISLLYRAAIQTRLSAPDYS